MSEGRGGSGNNTPTTNPNADNNTNPAVGGYVAPADRTGESGVPARTQANPTAGGAAPQHLRQTTAAQRPAASTFWMITLDLVHFKI